MTRSLRKLGTCTLLLAAALSLSSTLVAADTTCYLRGEKCEATESEGKKYEKVIGTGRASSGDGNRRGQTDVTGNGPGWITAETNIPWNSNTENSISVTIIEQVTPTCVAQQATPPVGKVAPEGQSGRYPNTNGKCGKISERVITIYRVRWNTGDGVQTKDWEAKRPFDREPGDYCGPQAWSNTPCQGKL